MNLLHIIGSMDPRSGGPCQVIRNLVPELQKLGMYNEVACLDDPNITFLQNDVFITHALGPHKNSWHYSPQLLPWLRCNLQRFNVIIVHGIWLYHSYTINKLIHVWCSSKKECRRIKVFVMPHGMLDPYFQEAPERRLKAL